MHQASSAQHATLETAPNPPFLLGTRSIYIILKPFDSSFLHQLHHLDSFLSSASSDRLVMRHHNGGMLHARQSARAKAFSRGRHSTLSLCCATRLAAKCDLPNNLHELHRQAPNLPPISQRTNPQLRVLPSVLSPRFRSETRVSICAPTSSFVTSKHLVQPKPSIFLFESSQQF